ncbi:MAG: CapA family protein [Anaerolineae bacterium]
MPFSMRRTLIILLVLWLLSALAACATATSLGSQRVAAGEIATPTATAAAVAAAASTPTVTSTPEPTPYRLAVTEEVLARFPSLARALAADRTIALERFGTAEEACAALSAGKVDGAVYEGTSLLPAMLVREEPYAAVAYALAPTEATRAALESAARGQVYGLTLVVGDDGAAVAELLGVAELPASAVRAEGWEAAREHVATHQGAWSLIPWEAVDHRVRVQHVDGIGLDPRDLAGYPLLRRVWFSPSAAPAPESLAQALADLAYAAPTTVELVAVGDIMLGRVVGEHIQEDGARYPFANEGIQALLAGADLTIGNLECPISDRGTPEVKEYTFRAAPAAIEGLQDAGMDVLSLANNHLGDYGPDATRDTLRLLDEAGITVVGAGQNVTEARQARVVEVDGLRIAFLAYNQVGPYSFAAGENSPGHAWMDAEVMASAVRAARAEADMVVVSCHWGYEYALYASAQQQELAQGLMEAGADLVIGHHPHVVQGLAFGEKGLAFFSLGNFVFDINMGQESLEGAAVRVLLDASGIKTWELVPYELVGSRPRLLSAEDGAHITDRMLRVTQEQGLLPR